MSSKKANSSLPFGSKEGTASRLVVLRSFLAGVRAAGADAITETPPKNSRDKDDAPLEFETSNNTTESEDCPKPLRVGVEPSLVVSSLAFHFPALLLELERGVLPPFFLSSSPRPPAAPPLRLLSS